MEMKIPLKILLMMALSPGLWLGCTKEATNIKPGPYEPKLSLECMLYPDSVPVLFLSRSQSYLGAKVNTLRDFVGNATVTITDGTQTDVLKPDSSFNYYNCLTDYYYRGTIPIRLGRTYQLEVGVDGQTLVATTSTNFSKVPPITSLTYVPVFNDLYGEHEGIVVEYTDKAGEANYYRLMMERTLTKSKRLNETDTTTLGCAVGPYRAVEIGRSVYRDVGQDGQPASFAVEPAFKHWAGAEATVRLETLDPVSADFFDNLDRQKLAQFNPFVEPVFLKTKIAGCLGVFGAVNVSDPALFVYPE
jgi:hypothetical protein